jgi:putative mRNA 3-end processing factor
MRCVARRVRANETGDLFAPRGGGIDSDPPAAAAVSPVGHKPAEIDLPLPVPPRADEEDAPAGDPSATPSLAPVVRPAPPPESFGEPAREFEFNGGVHLTDSILWCDADRRHDLCFVSHAHADFMGKNRRILATDKTVRILTRATGKAEALTSPYKRSFTLGPLTLEMHPAGHILGSAQLLIIRNDRRIVYTSDVNTRATMTAEKAKPVPCDTLVVPATYGLPEHRFPPREEVYEQIRSFVERCFEERATPVLIANQIGTAQELMKLLGDAGHRLRVHRSIYEVAKIYRDLGVSLPTSRRFAGTPARDEVVIFPPILRKHASIRKLRKSQTAMVSGRALDPGFAFRHKVDRAFCLSDTVDHDELIQFIQETGASEVYLASGHVEALGEELRAKGLRAYPLMPPRQLALF